MSKAKSKLSGRIDLDAADYTAEEHRIAEAISNEVEAARERMRLQLAAERSALADGSTPSVGADSSLVAVLSIIERERKLDSLAWDTILIEDLGVLVACEKTLRMPAPEVVQFARTNLFPQNWNALFWFEHYLRATMPQPGTAEETQRLIRKAQEEAAAAYGKAGADKRWEPYRAAMEYVRKLWSEERAQYAGNKSAFARAAVPRVKERFEGVDDVTERTIRENWLKGT